MIIVLPFCSKDGELCLKNILWMKELDGHLPFHCVLSHDTETPPDMVHRMKVAAESVFKSVDVFWYPAPEKKHWPAAPNWAWQSVARYVAVKHEEPWLFHEADAVPLRKRWLHDIAAEHEKGGKPFSGHIVEGMGHVNGSCVYPPDVSMFSQGAFRTEETAWDVVLGADLALQTGGVLAFVHPSHTLFQHCWTINPQDGRPWNGTGEVATFKNLHDVVRLVDVTMAVFHRCKDGSLIHWLREYHKDPSAAMVPQHTSYEESDNKPSVVEGEGGGREKGLRDNASVLSAEPVQDVQLRSFTGKCEIFIVTHGKDFPWLEWCLRALRRHATGFSGITLAIPNKDGAALVPIANEHAQAKGGIPLRIKMYQEKPGKGMIQHMAVMGSADDFVPKDTTHVLHLDSDCIYKEAFSPDSYIRDNKPEYVWRTYASLSEVRDGQKVVSDCVQWKGPTEAQLGFETDAYTMARHPSVFPIGFYKPYRAHIEALHKKPYLDYMLSGRNEFPQTRMDFTAMGAWAHKFMHDRFNWIDVSGGNHLAPRDLQKTYWSHSGVTDHIKQEIEGLLK